MKSEKGVALIIVIFAMMLFAVLGATLAVMQSGDFGINLRNLDSERAFNLAEAGAQWMLNQLVKNPGGVTKGNSYIHTLNLGQYEVLYRDSDTGLGEPAGNSVVESTGHIPAQAPYRATRKVKLIVSLGSIDKSVQVRYLFDWSGAFWESPIIFGDIGVTNRSADPNDGYEGNGVMPHNQDADVHVPIYPGGGARDLLSDDSGYPLIDMALMESSAGSNVWAPARAAEITNIQNAGGKSTITLDQNIFSDAGPFPSSKFNGQAIRNTSKGSWKSGSWQAIDTNGVLSANSVQLSSVVDWVKRDLIGGTAGDRVCVVPQVTTTSWSKPNLTVNFNCRLDPTVGNVMRNFTHGTWDYTNWGIIQNVSHPGVTTTLVIQFDNSVNNDPGWPGDWIGEVKWFERNHNNEIWYLKGDMLYDLRSRDANCNTSSFIAEGDIALMGGNTINITAHVKTSSNATLPNLASKNGNIYSRGGLAWFRRIFQGLVYTESGNVDFDNINGTSVYGYNVTLSGWVNLNYNTPFLKWSKYVDKDAFFSTFSSFSWQEQ